MSLRISIWLCAAATAATTVACGDSGSDLDTPQSGAAGSAGKPGGGSAGANSSGSNSGGTQNGNGGSAQSGAGGSAPGGSGGQAAAGSSSGGAAAGGSGGSAGSAPAVECSNLPSEPLKVEELKGPKAYHDIAFDGSGNLIGNDNSDLVKTALGGTPKPFLPGIGVIEGIDTFPNGDLVVMTAAEESSDTSLVRITPEGGQKTVTSLDYGGYGVRVGIDGFIYVAAMDALLRVDPDSGEKQTVPVDLESWEPRAIDFSPDKKKMYVAAQGAFGGIIPEDPVDLEGGTIYVFDLNEKGSPTGSPKVFAKDVGQGYMDGLGVDACGNLFVADFNSTALYRVTPDGKVALFYDWDETAYGHGLEWGNGVGGYERSSLYLPQPYDDNTVVRVNVGVPARPR